jgi:hypothetical protein
MARKLSPRTAYKRGRSFEYRCRDHFKRLGYHVVRSPKSAGPYDLLVMGHRIVLLVQCKSHGVLAPVEWNELFNLAGEIVASHAILASRSRRAIVLHRLVSAKAGRARQPMVRVTIGENRPE